MNVVEFKQIKFLKNRICMSIIIAHVSLGETVFHPNEEKRDHTYVYLHENLASSKGQISKRMTSGYRLKTVAFPNLLKLSEPANFNRILIKFKPPNQSSLSEWVINFGQ